MKNTRKYIDDQAYHYLLSIIMMKAMVTAENVWRYPEL